MADEKAKKDEKKAKKDDEKAKKGDGKGKRDEDTEGSESKGGNEKETESTPAAGPSLGGKAARAFLFTSLATFLAAYLFGDPLPNGLRVDFDLSASVKLALIAGVISAVLRAVAWMLPMFADDGDKKSKKTKDD